MWLSASLGFFILALEWPAYGPGGRVGFRLGDAPVDDVIAAIVLVRSRASGPATAPCSRSASVATRTSADVTDAATSQQLLAGAGLTHRMADLDAAEEWSDRGGAVLTSRMAGDAARS
jgi:hypothetical protein